MNRNVYYRCTSTSSHISVLSCAKATAAVWQRLVSNSVLNGQRTVLWRVAMARNVYYRCTGVRQSLRFSFFGAM